MEVDGNAEDWGRNHTEGEADAETVAAVGVVASVVGRGILVPSTPSPPLLVLLGTSRSRSTTSASPRHSFFENLAEALLPPLTPDVFNEVEL